LDKESKTSEYLGIIKVAFVRESSKYSIAKIQTWDYKSHQFLGIAPQEFENNAEHHKKWTDKISNS
jgi:hypothetical protein